jgi:hypothetical protein
MYDLARKANLRRRLDSILVTEEMIRTLYEQQEGRCALSEHLLDIQDKRWRPSLDRIDSSKGYVAGNMQLVAWIVNRSKSKFSDAAFREVCSAVAEAVEGSYETRQGETFEYAH